MTNFVDKYANQEVLPNALSIPDEYFTKPTSQPRADFILNPLPNTIAQQMDCVGKNVLINYSILKRNRRVHKELIRIKKGLVLLYRSKDTLNNALYHADIVKQGNKPTYRLLVSFKDSKSNKMYNAVATVNSAPAEKPNYVEVVDWFIKGSI